MKLKTLVLSVAFLALLSGLAFWLNRPPPATAADPRVGQLLADPTAIAQAAQLRLTDGGQTVLLARQPDGTWRVPGYFGLPADFSKLSSFIGDLSAAKIQRLVTVNPERISRLEFRDTKIELLTADGRALWSVRLGKTPETGGRFVRFGDEPKAYLANLNATIETDPKAWADATLFTLKPDEVARIDVPFDGGTTVAVSRKTKDAPWTAAPTPAGQKVSADKVSALLNSLGALRFSGTSDPADPQVGVAQAHLRTFHLTTFSGQTYRVALGRQPEEKKPKPAAAAAPKAPAPPADGAVPPPADAAADTIPAGPVYAFVASPDAQAPVNALMRQRAFQIDDYVFTGLPQKPDDLFEPTAPVPAPPPGPGSAR
jgi:hypothetical protein